MVPRSGGVEASGAEWRSGRPVGPFGPPSLHGDLRGQREATPVAGGPARRPRSSMQAPERPAGAAMQERVAAPA